MVFASVPEGDLVWTEGAEQVKTFASSSFGHRSFCGACGTPFLMKVDHQPETIDFSVATLDKPDLHHRRLLRPQRSGARRLLLRLYLARLRLSARTGESAGDRAQQSGQEKQELHAPPT